MKKLISVFLIFISITVFTKAQNENSFSIHRQQLEYYDQLNLTRTQLDSMHHFTLRSTKMYEGCQLNKVVFGWFPYWQGSTYLNFEWSLLSDLSYFAYEVDASTGNATSTHSWATAAVIDSAQAHGVRVNLCVTLFSNHATFFGSSTAQQTLIDNLISLVQQRNANGVNIDFEGVPSSQATNLNNFLVNLCTQMHSQIPGSQVSIALYAVDWGNVFDETVLNNYIDYFIIMGYDYYYGGSSTAGPNDPLYPFTTTGYNLSRSINYYLNAGISKEKLVLGLPYYGFDWPTASSALFASTTASASTKLFNTVMNNSSGYYSAANKHWDNNSMSSYWVYNDGSSWHQCFVDDADAMAKRLDLINQTGIAGMGIWALGYDDGYTDMWDVIAGKFSTCGTVPCSDTIYDNGGPGRNYYDNSDYTFTIQPSSAMGVSLAFNSLDLEAGYDSLWIYDGNDINAPLLASLSGNTLPAPVIASGNTLTLHFHSDGATNGSGWEAVWQCSQDNQPPVTNIVANNWYPGDFTASFLDTDNDTITKRWFNYIYDQNGTWDCYRDSGYFFDNLSTTSINSAWVSQTGTWQTVPVYYLEQTDETESNTNYYIAVNQNMAQSLVYSWQMAIGGSGTNRRAGIHFYCDSPTATNRNNSYMVYFRVDQNKVQIYKYINDTMHLETDDDCQVDSGQTYSCKVIYDKTTGVIDVYQDDILVSSWTDPSPYTTGGDYISLRTGNAKVSYHYFNVFSERDTLHHFQVSNETSFKIFSIVKDGNKNLSQVDDKTIRIDQTPPVFTGEVRDGTSVDIDSVFINTDYFANWSPATEDLSPLTYRVALGTTPRTDNIYTWTSVTDTTVHFTGLNLQMDTVYYISVIAVNAAGLPSADTISSDGALMTVPLSQPHAAFTIQVSDTLICRTNQVTFINNSTDAQSYQWSFPGGSPATSTAVTPTVTYNDTGYYDVSLIAANSIGSDTAYIANTIHVVALPIADFDVVSQSGQVPFTAYFINNSINTDYYYWLFETASGIDSSFMFEPYLVYYDTGCYDVTLVASNSVCPSNHDTLTIPDFICVTTGLFTHYSDDNGITVFPNPVKDILHLKFSEKINGTLHIRIYNTLSKCLIEKNKKYTTNNLSLKTNRLPPGNYFLELIYKNQVFKIKFTKIK